MADTPKGPLVTLQLELHGCERFVGKRVVPVRFRAGQSVMQAMATIRGRFYKALPPTETLVPFVRHAGGETIPKMSALVDSIPPGMLVVTREGVFG